MVQLVTEGVGITVETFYQDKNSNPLRNEFVHAYRITIENFCSYPIKLLSRNWFIFDSYGNYKEVEGEGVVGRQPVISSNEKYQYVSAVNLYSDMGTMSGSYTMENLANKKNFTVYIPEFQLICPAKLN